MRGALALACAWIAAVGCTGRHAYKCAASDQCVIAGVQGTCEPEGFCSVPDSTCPGGRRFADESSTYSGTCIAMADAPLPDAPACGHTGEACCTASTACEARAACTAGTCQSCVADIAMGRHFNCVLRTDKTVWCVGDNVSGQLGFGLAGPSVDSWSEVRDSTTSTVISDATAIGVGGETACVIRTGGALWCWGANSGANAGQVGNNTVIDAPAAVAVQVAGGGPLLDIKAVAGGRFHTCALDTSGGVWCFGVNAQGQLGDGTNTPRSFAVPVLDAPMGSPITGVVELALGDRMTCARKTDSSVWCWGWNTNGALGNGDSTLMARSSPTLVAGSSATSIESGPYAHSCMVTTTGKVLCWGSTWRGRLGNGTTNTDPPPNGAVTPVEVITSKGGPALVGATQVAIGGTSCALMSDGTVQCWGDNTHGLSGRGVGSPYPGLVLDASGQPLDQVTKLIAGFPHMCARRTSGELLCWGRNLDGEYGDHMKIDRATPAPLEFPCQ